MLVLEKSRNNAVETLGSLRAIVLQTPSFLCAAPNENGHGVNFLHLESKFYFRMHLYFILYFILSPVIFCSQSIFSLVRLKLCLVPISFRQEKIMSHCSPLILAQVLAVLYEKVQIKSSLYDHLLQLLFGQMSNEFFLVSVDSNINSSSTQRTFLVIVTNSRKISTTTFKIPTLRSTIFTSFLH